MRLVFGRNPFHCQRNPLFLRVAGKYLDGDDVADLQAFGRMFDEAVGNLRDVNEPVLMDADVDECAEIGQIAHRSLQNHPFVQVGEIHDVRPQQRRRQGQSRPQGR